MNLVKKLLNNIKKSWQDFYQDILNHQRATLIVLLAILLLVTAASVFYRPIKNRIYAAELENIVYKDFDSKKVSFFDYAKKDQRIKESGSITVLFAKPQGADYDEAVKLLSHADIEAQLKGSVYYYPLVYQTQKAVDQYKVKENQVTFVLYEKGKEKQRFTYHELTDAPNQLADTLNQMAAGDAKAAKNATTQ